MLNIDAEWDDFINDIQEDFDVKEEEFVSNIDENIADQNYIPKCSNIYISTKTKIAYLDRTIDLNLLFWKIPVINYSKPICGVIKKQMKFNSLKQSELDEINNHLTNESNIEEYIITHIDNPNGRISFKDIRKISIGICKKDIISYRCKKKSAFYNCFVLILRLKEDNIFKEYHAKIFNTGKLEIPGVQSESSFKKIINMIEEIISNLMDEHVSCLFDKSETVLINSNFNCGFYIKREILNELLKYKYKIQSIYDPCSYPGIQCKFYYDSSLEIQTGIPPTNITESISIVSFMIFRTGSVLIVGKCDEEILMKIYNFVKNILLCEYTNIKQSFNKENQIIKEKNKKVRKKIILIDK